MRRSSVAVQIPKVGLPPLLTKPNHQNSKGSSIEHNSCTSICNTFTMSKPSVATSPNTAENGCGNGFSLLNAVLPTLPASPSPNHQNRSSNRRENLIFALNQALLLLDDDNDDDMDEIPDSMPATFFQHRQ